MRRVVMWCGFACILFGLTLSPLSAMPITVSGNLSTSYRYTASEVPRSHATSQLSSLELRAASYIWRPWLAVISGDGLLSVSESDSTANSKQSNQFTTGSGRLGLFPSSRFPFRAYYSVTDSRNEFEDFELASSTKRYGLNQQYHNLANDLKVSAGLDKNIRERAGEELTSTEHATFTVSKSTGSNQFALGASGDLGESVEQNLETKSFDVTGTHDYSGDQALSLNNMVTKSSFYDVMGDDIVQTTSQQYSTAASWRPMDMESLTVTSSFRAQTYSNEADIDDEVDTDQRRMVNLATSASYQLSPILSMSGSANVNKAQNMHLTEDGADAADDEEEAEEDEILGIGDSEFELVDISEVFGLSLYPEDIPLGLYQYNSSYSANAANQHGDMGSSQQVSLNANQGLERDFPYSEQNSLRMTVNQGLSTINSTMDRASQVLAHSLNFSWNPESENGFSTARFSLSDSRQLSEGSVFQAANLQITHSVTIDRESNWSGDLTVQASRATNDGMESELVVFGGGIRYEKSSLFTVPNLNYRTDITFASDALTPSSDAFDTAPDEETKWKNTVGYRIGLLLAEFSTLLISNNGKLNRGALVKVSRAF